MRKPRRKRYSQSENPSFECSAQSHFKNDFLLKNFSQTFLLKKSIGQEKLWQFRPSRSWSLDSKEKTEKTITNEDCNLLERGVEPSKRKGKRAPERRFNEHSLNLQPAHRREWLSRKDLSQTIDKLNLSQTNMVFSF